MLEPLIRFLFTAERKSPVFPSKCAHGAGTANGEKKDTTKIFGDYLFIYARP